MPVTNYLWDTVNDTYLTETEDGGDPFAIYTNEPSKFGPLISQRRDSTSGFYHFDGQQSTRALTDASETVTDSNTYAAFGETVDSRGSTVNPVNPFGFNGAIGYFLNPETSDHYWRRAEYQSPLARWISIIQPDLVDFEYHVYADNDPIGRADRSRFKDFQLQFKTKIKPSGPRRKQSEQEQPEATKKPAAGKEPTAKKESTDPKSENRGANGRSTRSAPRTRKGK